MKEIIEVLKEFADIEHWMALPSNEGGDDLTHPPIVTWRYKQRSSELAGILNRAISSFAGTMGWDLTITDRNWSLKPSRITEYAKMHGCTGTLSAARELKIAEPEFGIRANAELRRLAEHIQKETLHADRLRLR